MSHPSRCTRDVFAVLVASCGALLSAWFSPTTLEQALENGQTTVVDRGEPAGDAAALDGLIDAQEAARAGSWWIDEAAVQTRLSFAPEHQRLVWQVHGQHEAVTLDAATGEALAFDFE